MIENLIFFGGVGGKYWLNDLLIFDLAKLKLNDPVQTQGITPVGRLQHSAIILKKNFHF